MSEAAGQEMSAFEARTIIEALRRGTVPMEQVSRFSVGRERWLKFIADDLSQYVASGGSKVRFINGDYGDGKTHFMSVVRQLALEQGFAVGFVVLSQDVPLHKFEVVYQGLTRALQVPGLAGSGMAAILEGWVRSQEATWRGEEGGEPSLVALGEELRGLDGMDASFANALLAYAKLSLSSPVDEEGQEARRASMATLVRWFEGARLPRRDLKPLDIFECVDKTNGRRFLAALIAFVRKLGCRGLVWLFDELEIVMGMRAAARAGAFESVRSLIDNAEQTGHLHIFFSIIPDVILTEKGFRSYDALWSRVRNLGDESRLNYRGVLIDLHRTPLTRAELVDLGGRLRRMHEWAYRWSAGAAVDDSVITEMCVQQERMGVMSEVRLFIRQLIRALDMAEQGQAIGQEELGANLMAAQGEIEQERAAALTPRWDA